ncbi:MAG: hypothetical protein ABSA79_09030 [Candidatus Bathyarchaeia archaeon]
MGNEAQIVLDHYTFVHVAKPHGCFICEALISKKDLALNVTGKNRFWYSRYYCSSCCRAVTDAISDKALRERLLAEFEKLVKEDIS